MLRRIFNGSVLAVLVLVLAACGTAGGGGGGGSINFAGSWSGELVDSSIGAGRVQAHLTQSGTDLGGTWQSEIADVVNSGSAIGVVNGSDIILELIPSNPTTCPFRLVGTGTGNSLTGTYAAFNCTISVGGTFTLQRQ